MPDSALCRQIMKQGLFCKIAHSDVRCHLTLGQYFQCRTAASIHIGEADSAVKIAKYLTSGKTDGSSANIVPGAHAPRTAREEMSGMDRLASLLRMAASEPSMSMARQASSITDTLKPSRLPSSAE